MIFPLILIRLVYFKLGLDKKLYLRLLQGEVVRTKNASNPILGFATTDSCKESAKLFLL